VAVSGGKVREGVGYLLIVPAFGGGDGVVGGLFVFRVRNTSTFGGVAEYNLETGKTRWWVKKG
jgi:hypothetical protein